jgi:hypothetical protein
MSEVPLYMVVGINECLLENDLCGGPAELCRGTSLPRNRPPLGPCTGTLPGVLW